MRQHIFVFGVAHSKFAAYRRCLHAGMFIQKPVVLVKFGARRNFAAVVNITAYKIRFYRKTPLYVHAGAGHYCQKHRLRFAFRKRIGNNGAAYNHTLNLCRVRAVHNGIQRCQYAAQHLAVRCRALDLRMHNTVIYQNGIRKSAANIYT